MKKQSLQSLFWRPYSRLFIKGDEADWSLYWDAVELSNICRQLGIQVVFGKCNRWVDRQCFFNMSRYEFLENWKRSSCRIAFPYYHGNPSTDENSRRMLQTVRRHHKDISRIQVSCRFMEDVILDTGIDRNKVFRIPIGINNSYFKHTSPALKTAVRQELGIPFQATVIGSFQKDGNGMQEGLEPKLIKGPDILLETLSILRKSTPDLFILLTGPARGYIKKGLEALKIPYSHNYLNDYREIGKYFNALDAYIISSRDEGGPKAVLESMASGVPLISTKVGQAVDLIEHEKNGFLADIEDAEALAYWTDKMLQDSAIREQCVESGIQTALDNDYNRQLPLWKAFMTNFIE